MKKRMTWSMVLVTLLGLGLGWFFLYEKKEVTVASKAVDRSGQDYQELSAAVGVPKNKTWTLSYEGTINKETVHDGSVYVLNGEGEKETVSLKVNKNVLTILPPKGNYEDGRLYTLYIESEVNQTTPVPDNASVKMDFIVEREKETAIELNKDMVTLEKTDVKQIEDDFVLLQKTRETEKLKKDQIVLVPTEDNMTPIAARKVVSTSQTAEGILVRTIEPEFTEIVPEMNISDTFSLGEGTFIPYDESITVVENPSIPENTTASAEKSDAPRSLFDIIFNPKMEPMKVHKVADGTGMEQSFNVPIPLSGADDLPLTMKATITIKNPQAKLDIEYDKKELKRFNMEYQLDQEQEFVFFANITDPVELSKPVPTRFQLPVGKYIQPLPVGGGIVSLTIEAYLKGEIDSKGRVKATLTTSQSPVYSIVKKDDGPHYVHDLNPSVKVAVNHSGTVEAGIFFGGGVGIEAGGVIGASMLGEIGEKLIATSVNMKDELFGKISCSQVEEETSLAVNFTITLADRFELFKSPIQKRVFSYADFIDTCVKYHKFEVDPSPLSFEKGVEQEVKVKHHYLVPEELEIKQETIPLQKLLASRTQPEQVTVKGSKVLVSEEFVGKAGSFSLRSVIKDIHEKPTTFTETIPYTVEEEEKEDLTALEGTWEKPDSDTPFVLEIENVTERELLLIIRKGNPDPYLADLRIEVPAYRLETGEWAFSFAPEDENWGVLVDGGEGAIVLEDGKVLMNLWYHGETPISVEEFDISGQNIFHPYGSAATEEKADSPLTGTQAEEIIRNAMDVPENIMVVHDHTKEDNYIIHVYKVVDSGGGGTHTATSGWYGVNKYTGEWYDHLAAVGEQLR